MNYPKSKKVSFIDEYGSNFIEDDFNWLTDAFSNEASRWLEHQHEFTSNYFKDIDYYDDELDKLTNEDLELNIISLSKSHDLYTGVYDDPNLGLTAFESKDLKDFTVLQRAGHPYTTIFSAEASPTDPNIYVFSGYYKNETRVSNNVYNKKLGKVVSRFGFGFDYLFDKSGDYIYYSEAIVDKHDASKSIQHISRYHVETNVSELLYVYEDDAVVVYFEQCGDNVLVKIDKNYHDTKLLLVEVNADVVELSGMLDDSYSFVGLIDDQMYFVSDEVGDKYSITHFSLSDGLESRKRLSDISAYELSAYVTGDKLLVISKVDAEDVAHLYDKNGSLIEEVQLPDDFANLRVIGTDTNNIYIRYESILAPAAVLSFDKDSLTIKELVSLSNEEHADLVVEKHEVRLRDNAQTVIYVAYSDKHKPVASSPLLMYGYGGYGASQSMSYRDPSTDLSIKDWCEAGGVYANVILRGGGEYGNSWHDAGRLDNKLNSFNDLFDVTEYLHKLEISSPAKTAVGGASNGGLLVSAAFAHRPDLYACIIDSVALVDMLHFVKDPRGSMYKTEYGDPYDPEMFDYLKAYSPYHQLEVGVDYPAIYIQSGLLDTNVPPYHGMKLAAKAQGLNPSGKPILLRVLPHGHHDTGHGDERLQTLAERRTFIKQILNI